MPESSGGSSAASANPQSGAVPVGAALDLCDRLLGEIGRRQHRFAWLRPPGSGIEDCLVCDAYYPGQRLVVICREDGADPDALYSEEVPRHGLRLLVIAPWELGMDRLSASEALVSQIGTLEPLPDRPGAAKTIERPRATRSPAASPATSSPAPAAAGTATSAHRGRRPEPRRGAARTARPERPALTEHEQRFGMLIGVALVIVLAAESLVLVAVFALGHDHPVLAFGFALDACARALGTIAAARQGDYGQAWRCMLIGSPSVLNFALLDPDGAVKTEPGPLAGVVSGLALATLVIAALGALLGI